MISKHKESVNMIIIVLEIWSHIKLLSKYHFLLTNSADQQTIIKHIANVPNLPIWWAFCQATSTHQGHRLFQLWRFPPWPWGRLMPPGHIPQIYAACWWKHLPNWRKHWTVSVKFQSINLVMLYSYSDFCKYTTRCNLLNLGFTC